MVRAKTNNNFLEDSKMSEVNMKQAKEVFATMVKMLDAREWHYNKDEENLVIQSGVKGDDLPVEFIVAVDAEREVVRFMSKLPFSMPEEKRVDGAIAVCVANNGIVNGNFDYDINDGEIVFRLTTSFKSGSVLSEDLFEYMIMASAHMVDRYNDKFFMLAKGMMNIQQFIEQENS